MSNMLDSLFICTVYKSHICTVRSEFLWQNILIHVSKDIFKIYLHLGEYEPKVNFSVTLIFFASSNNSVKMQLGILDEGSAFEARTPTCSSCL